ncbi:unnamed protein product [Pieris macdunnoughi]|uniref:Uncharacterized protein n=1 Tax=Pieris macdunnoughi TaxID=345717 RepID=A0A821YCW1_9NEOP|nr:unnamed protein product [Pieris macdunnoughi]
MEYLVILLFGVLKVSAQFYNIISENPIKPEKCMGSDDILLVSIEENCEAKLGFALVDIRRGYNPHTDRHCCIVPAFFDRFVVRSCGGITEIFEVHKKEGVALGRRHFVPDCTFWECVLKKYKMLNEDKTVSTEKFYTHLEKWASLNKPFSTLLLSAKIHCRQYFIMFMPLSTCEFYNFLLCFRDYLKLYDCPVLIQSQKCYEWKEFFDECKQYYLM